MNNTQIEKLKFTHHRGKGGAADQSVHGRMGLGTACKGETSRVKNISIESPGGRKLCLWVEENCVFTGTIPKYTHIYIYTYFIKRLWDRGIEFHLSNPSAKQEHRFNSHVHRIF
jgi:hypothetical protein